MRFIDWFAGIGGIRLGLERAGHECVWACERDAFARRVYAARFGHEPQSDDIATVRPADVPAADLWAGGFPCQDLSVAGLRSGFCGARSSLVFTLLDLAAACRPPWLLLENVPGLLSLRDGHDFGRLLGALDDLGYVGAWRVLDARYFGVPQRRRRVFLVCRLGDGGDPAEILLEPEGVRGDSPAGGSPWEDFARPLGCGVTRGGGHRVDLDGGALVVRTAATGANGVGVAGDAHAVDTHSPEAVLAPTLRHGAGGGRYDAHPTVLDTSHTLSTQCGQVTEDGTGHGAPLVAFQNTGHGWWNAEDQATALASYGDHAYATNLVANTVRASDGHHGHSSARGDGCDNLVVADPISAHEQGTYSHEGKTFRLRNVVAHAAFDAAQITHPVNRATVELDAPTPPLNCSAKVRVAAFQEAQTGVREYVDSGTLRANGPGHDPVGTRLRQGATLRRLTPRECERLQGLPDDWTLVEGATDAARYRAIGNGVAVPVIEWLGHRFARCD